MPQSNLRAPTVPGLILVSGGSAANKLASTIANAGLSAVHILAVFDNGGSTGRLRDVFGEIALGDIRNRLVILAGRHSPRCREIADLLGYRLSGNKSQELFRNTVEGLARGVGLSHGSPLIPQTRSAAHCVSFWTASLRGLIGETQLSAI